LVNTYTRALPGYLDENDMRLHTNFQLTATSTGRFSSQDPNLQNIPIRSTEGAKIRAAFAATPGNVIIAADYSQIELRILAHIADIEQMKKAIIDGKDIHAATAYELFGEDIDPHDNEIRRRAKAINFGIIYGISPFGLAKRLSISKDEAKDYIERYFEKFPGIQHYMDETIKHCKTSGFVTTLYGRKCHIPDINTSNYNMRNFAERAAINAPLQGTASDIMRKAMVMLPSIAKKYLILQIHDEFLFEVPESEAESLAIEIRKAMESVCQLDVPLSVDVSVKSHY